MRLVLVVLFLAACASEGDEDALTEETTSSVAVPAVTVDQVRDAAVGTAACPGPDCSVIEAVELDGGALVVRTGLFPDSDAEAPGLSVCVAATTVWDGPVSVEAGDGSVLARGEVGRTPICS